MSSLEESKARKSQFGDDKSGNVTWTAVTTGLWKSLPVAAASFGGVWYASRQVPSFHRWFGPSGKVALCLMPPMAAWSYFSEVGIGAALNKNLDIQSGMKTDTAPTELPLKLRLANYFYDHTLAAYLSLVTPLYGVVLGHELTKPRPPGWRFSHAVIHTRVIGQAIAITSLCVVFGSRETLKRNGAPFKLPDELGA